ncbi:hypothetical protein PTKU64_91320 (plasmid) [Paraburkholderia terrae]|uniref:Uncharacterized protein n=1 Tax=Paraburkholderia terrae TaxID=311230 RepID=A0ABN6JWX7_9BURK|nr:hypothetical protein [Paraburkholderia terrae]BCZ85457.1 hypothetical protein PTKU64_91320 [Paraburkholderia terrae]
MKSIHSSAGRYRSSSWEHVCAASDGIPADFARLLRDEVRPLQIAYQRLMCSYGGHPAGIECRMKKRESWAFALPDAAGAKSWRVQQFDQDGFIGHQCFDSLSEAVEEMLRMGYLVTDPGALDRIGCAP